VIQLAFLPTGGMTLSKSKLLTFETCPAQFHYRYEMRLAPDYAPGPEVERGVACHAAVATAVRAGEDIGASARIRETLARWPLVGDDAGQLCAWATAAARWLRSRGGQIGWVEESCRAVGLDGIVLEARFDAVVFRGSAGPLEVVDWKFGREPRRGGEAALAQSIDAATYRLAAGLLAPGIRPIVVTEVHVPSMTVFTCVPDEDQVNTSLVRLRRAEAALLKARETGDWAPVPGKACLRCLYRWTCGRSGIE